MESLEEIRETVRRRARERRLVAEREGTGPNLVSAGEDFEIAAARIDLGLQRAERLAAQLNGPPPRPPTIRGTIGALLSSVVRRALAWRLSQMQRVLAEQLAAQREMLDLLESSRARRAEPR